jgi:outer membrane protein
VDAQIRAAELRIEETQHAVIIGVALELRADEVRAQVAQAKHSLGQLQDAVADMKEELADLVGLPIDTDLQLTPPGDASPITAPVSVEFIHAAMANNAELESAAHQVDKAKAGVNAARAQYIPDIAAYAQYIHQNGAPFLSPNNGAFGFQMTWTVFEFGKRRNEVVERRSQVTEAEENLSHLQNRVQIDVEKAVRRLNRAETALESARRLLTETTEARRVRVDEVEAGTTNRSALLDAEAAESSAQADLLRAEYDRGVAAADLARLTGTR